MKYYEAIEALTNFLSSDLIVNDFSNLSVYQPFDGCSPCISDVNPNLPKDSFGHQSGVYFLCSLDEDIYYIGKATKDNLHEEVWGKLKTPDHPKDDEINKKITYPKNYFLNRNLDKQAILDVENGNIKIGILVISNPILASLAEVYIQTVYCQKNNNMLPKLNSRIG